jgi:dTDP-4-amino-4,6-dideoxygalactose transaminase
MFDIQAALGLKQLERIEEMQKRREQIAVTYNNKFKDIDAIEIPVLAEGTTTHSRHLYIIRLKLDKLTIDRNRFIEELYEYNIGASVHFIPVHLMSAYRNRFGYKEGDFPNTESHFERIVSIPLYSTMSDADVNDVVNAVTDIAGKYHI